jgi:hypothetical protein
MVTRRPIELTLVHSPSLKKDYCTFDASMRLGDIIDFDIVRSTLVNLNMAVSDEECVGTEPINLCIYSPYVPDLTVCPESNTPVD